MAPSAPAIGARPGRDAAAPDEQAAPRSAAAEVTALPPAPASTSTASVRAAAPTSAGTPAGTAAQLAPAVIAVHRPGVDGTHRLTVDLTPAELGPVRLTVALRGGEMHLLLAGHTEATREALRAALPDLRRLVEAAGLTAGAFDVQPDRPDPHAGWSGSSGGGPDARGGAGTPHGVPAPPRRPPSTDGTDVLPGAGPKRPAAGAHRSLDLHL